MASREYNNNSDTGDSCSDYYSDESTNYYFENDSSENNYGRKVNMNSDHSNGHGSQRRGTNKKTTSHAGSRAHHRRPKTRRILMPTNIMASITTPDTAGWRCSVDKTKLITLRPNGQMGRKEYQLVANEMQNTIENSMLCFISKCITGFEILKIQKVVNGCLFRRYQKYQEVAVREAGSANERMLFHGSSQISELIDNGFDERYANINGRFGAGIYFAQHSTKSNQYVFDSAGCQAHQDPNCIVCHRQLLLCRVTLGKVYQLYFGKTLSHAPQGYHSVEGTRGITKRYPEYVVYRGEQAYPEYLITYKLV